MSEIILDLKFKGDRNYLQGPDIFNDTLSWLYSQRGEILDIDFSFHHQAFHQLKVILGDLPESVKPVAVCSFSSSGRREKAYLIETNKIIKVRYPYSEEDIASRLKINLDKRSGVLCGETSFSEIETLVAMGKVLHQHVFPELKGKWLFVRARLRSYDKYFDSKDRALVIAATFNNQLTRCEIFYEGNKGGEIYSSII